MIENILNRYVVYSKSVYIFVSHKYNTKTNRMNLIELYKSKTIAEKQELIDSIRLRLTNTRETTIRSWLSGKRNPKSFAKKVIAKVLKVSESELFPN